MPESCTALATMVESTVSSSSVEFTACDTSPSARSSLDRAAEFVGALAQFVEQSRILDGDDCLVGEGLDQLDLLVGEGLHLVAVDDEYADRRLSRKHGNAEHCASAPDVYAGDHHRIAFGISLLVRTSRTWTSPSGPIARA